MPPSAPSGSSLSARPLSSLASSCSSPATPEFVSVILAATPGARLYPLTTQSPSRSNSGEAATSTGAQQDGQKESADNDYIGGGRPKHLLPVGGEPIVTRLIHTVKQSGFSYCVVAVGGGSGEEDDDGGGGGGGGGNAGASTATATGEDEKECGWMERLTLDAIRKYAAESCVDSSRKGGNESKMTKKIGGIRSHHGGYTSVMVGSDFEVICVALPSDCNGSADALRYLAEISRETDGGGYIIPRTSHVMVMPGDLVLEGKGVLGLLADAHRRGGSSGHGVSACTMLLSDVGEEDENGLPLKESAKQKKGGLARDEEGIEYTGLSPHTITTTTHASRPLKACQQQYHSIPTHRVILKRSKLDVEKDDNTGNTPKLSIPKSTLIHVNPSNIRVRQDLSDVHVYALSPWVLRLIEVRTHLSSIQKEIIPLLISRQFKGVQAAFGKKFALSQQQLTPSSTSSLQPSEENQQSAATGTTADTTIDQQEKDQMVKSEIINETLASLYNPQTQNDNNEPNDDHDELKHLKDHNNPNHPTHHDETHKFEIKNRHHDTSHHRKQPYPPISFLVSATTIPRGGRIAMRACTVPSYLYVCREIVSHAIRFPEPSELVSFGCLDNMAESNARKVAPVFASAFTPLEGTVRSKFNAIILPHVKIGGGDAENAAAAKVTIKSSTVGSYSTLGTKCRLNNVVLMNNVSVGDNCILQNSVISDGCKIGDGVNLNDVQVGPGAVVDSGTKVKGETITAEVDEGMEEMED
eukprot:CAMPEP_0195531802 /NCGR_PEP_ID=MMETSP0794_2-20130614/36353_1 /TAXON_ID=515487 /ORGANISM="Stephanopyxis turris, Strain CCMP 815" /LENGTH=752 /DNA_ID=CAMNT_0040663735 /DNA_START=10 /DNA_END=2265 /DNA_ORIENTATION=+